MKAIAIVGNAERSGTLLADLLHWHGLSAFQVDASPALLPLLNFISPELIVIESSAWVDAELICARIRGSSILRHIPVVICSEQECAGYADAYVGAPYSAEEIFASIQALRPLSEPLSDSVIARLDS
ncbi:MAG: hypothetical protein ACFB2W_26780 [Leptolyngbyaceae cyanobacterium]